MRSRVVVAAIALMVSCLVCPLVQADSFNVTITTTPIQGQTGFALFDFLQGDTSNPSNSVTISNFMTDAMLGAGSSTGAVSGTLVPGPLTLNNSQFFNEWAQAMTFGNTMSFTINLTTNSASVPDEFSFFLTDSFLNPFTTSDPTGANSLFTIDITGSPLSPEVFTSDFASVTLTPINEVPEPSSAVLIISMLGISTGMLGYVKRSRCLRQS